MKAVFFDLDYTLYDQRQFLLGSLAAVAERLAAQCERDPALLTTTLRDLWEQEGTDCPDLFNRWLTLVGLLDADHVRLCVEAFHGYAPAQMELFPSAHRVLRSLHDSYWTGIITDGHASMQRSKLAALGVEPLVHRVFLPHEHGMKKPDPRIFQRVLHEDGFLPHEAMYVGDHPIKDIMAASLAGLPTVRVLTGEFASLPDHPEHPPTHRVGDLGDVPRVVERARGQSVPA
jgi:HAD superfamily hydrolase (TIGR01549 family)